MNRFPILFVTLVSLASCSAPKKAEPEVAQINKVETGLRGSIGFTDDSTWTIESRMAHYGVPGVSIAVIKDNKIAWLKSYGIKDKESKEPVTTTTLFQAGSISKPVAAYGALHLVEAGRLTLDEDVNTYLKSWKLPDNEFTAKKKVALKHLVNHSGGLTVHGFLGYSPDLPVPTLVQVLDGAPPANSPPVRVDKVPEESFRYSGGGYSIMQQMMIDVEGKAFPEIMREIVLQPLGMSNSTYDQPLTGTQLQQAATGYLPDGSMTKGKRHTYPEMAAAGLWTTAEDLGKFAIDVQKSVKGESHAVLSKDMTTKMLTPFVADFVGLGLFINKKGNSVYFGHGGWDEGFSSEMVAHKDKGYGVVVLTNSNHPAFISEVINSVAAAYNWDNYLKTYEKLEMDTTKFAGIRGTYFNGNDGTIKIYSQANKLFIKYLRGTPYELFKITDSTYISRDADHGENPVQFKVNPADGKMNCVFVEAGHPTSFVHARKADSDKVPYEYLLAGDFEKALQQYQLLQKADPKDKAINEGNINQQGYQLLEDGNLDLSKKMFRINMSLYPKSANTFDSYADACLQNGDKSEAIENYRKALKLNPELKNTKNKLEDLLK